MLDVVFGQASDPRKVRANNENLVGAFIPRSHHQARSHGYLFAVADGGGSADLGLIASATAISALTDEFEKSQSGAMLISLLPRLVQHANSAVHKRALEAEVCGKKMATTVVVCALRYDQAVVSHVGDSRCYLVRKGIAKQITQDHTWMNEQHQMGLISEDKIEKSESRHVLIRSLGPQLFVSSDTTALTIHAGDVLVLSSSGLHNELPETSIAAIVSQNKNVDETARDLVAHAIEKGSKNNTTVLIIRIRSVEQVNMYRDRPYRLPS